MKRSRAWVLVAAVLLGLAWSSGAGAEEPKGERPAGPPWGRMGGGPRPMMLFHFFDVDESGSLTEDEVPAPVWARLSQADLNEDGEVTREEIRDTLIQRGVLGNRPAGSRQE